MGRQGELSRPRQPLTPADESFRHQAVAPALETAHVDPAWAERCWHLLNVGGGWVLGAGRAVWPHGGRRTAVAGLCTGATQLSLRLREPFAAGDDPDRADVGPVRIEAVRPLEEIRLVLDDPGFGLAFDLTWRARFAPVATDRNRIERDGVVVTDYMNLFQSGLYSGVVRVDGEERRLDGRAGFRDRGWGLRKHEGTARRGMHVFCACELPDEALYVLLYETASGRRVFTNGWLLDASGLADTVVAAEHDLRLDGRRLLDGRLGVELASGARREVRFEAEGRLWMETLGYTAVPGRADPGAERWDVTDPGRPGGARRDVRQPVRLRGRRRARPRLRRGRPRRPRALPAGRRRAGLDPARPYQRQTSGSAGWSGAGYFLWIGWTTSSPKRWICSCASSSDGPVGIRKRSVK